MLPRNSRLLSFLGRKTSTVRKSPIPMGWCSGGYPVSSFLSWLLRHPEGFQRPRSSAPTPHGNVGKVKGSHNSGEMTLLKDPSFP